MRVLINGRFLSQKITGVQRYAYELVKALDGVLQRKENGTEGVDVVLIAPRDARDIPGLSSIKMERAGKLRGHGWEQIELPILSRGELLLSLCQIGPVAKRRHVVVMHDASVYAIPWAFSWTFRTWYQSLMPRLAHRAAAVMTVSEFSRKELARFCGVDERRVVVSSEGAEHILGQQPDRSILSQHRLTAGKFVLAVSSLNPNKNFAGIAKAMSLLHRPDFDVVIAGGLFPKVFPGTVELPSWIKHVGYVSDAQLRALYEGAGCFVFPSFYEGFGLPPIEAMLCGCPVIVSNVASLPEVCGSDAVFCDPTSAQDIANAVERLMGDAELKQKLATAGRARAALFTWDAAAKRVWDVAQQVIDQRR